PGTVRAGTAGRTARRPTPACWRRAPTPTRPPLRRRPPWPSFPECPSSLDPLRHLAALRRGAARLAGLLRGDRLGHLLLQRVPRRLALVPQRLLRDDSGERRLDRLLVGRAEQHVHVAV